MVARRCRFRTTWQRWRGVAGWKVYRLRYPESADAFAPANRLAVIPIEAARHSKLFSPGHGHSAGGYTVVEDGNSILYTVTANNVTNIWSQPLDGGQPKQVTDFKEMLMTGFCLVA